MCDYRLLGVCLTQPPAVTGDPIFGFGDFLTALALLVLVYSSTDPIYRFRISVAPLRLYPLTFWTTLLVGGGSLVTDLWFSERWLAPAWGVTRAQIQAGLGVAFLMLTLTWTWFAFVRPAVFGRLNAKAYFWAVYRAVVRGSEAELAAVASELGRSANPLVRYAVEQRHQFPGQPPPPEPKPVQAYATQLLMLLGNRKLCRHVVATSPETAMLIMQEAGAAKRYRLPLGQFAENLTTEALLNRDSRLYHEDFLSSDLSGYWQPFTNAVYGDFELVEGTQGGSPFDIDYRVDLTAPQLDAYCRIILCTLKSYVAGGSLHRHSYVFSPAIDRVKSQGSRDLHRLNGSTDPTATDAEQRFRKACHFIKDALDVIGRQPNIDLGRLRVKELGPGHTIMDQLAEAAADLVFAAASVREPQGISWHVQHNTAWEFFKTIGVENTPARRAFQFKLARLLYDEIVQLEKLPNFKGSAILSIVLNCIALGGYLRLKSRNRAIGKATLQWVRRNYIRLADKHPPVAADCLPSDTRYDPAKARLVRIREGGLSLEPWTETLSLQRPPRPR